MEHFFHNKKVVIVSGSPYLINKNKGSIIDSYDIVVRINQGLNLTKCSNDYGSKTDILYHCLCQSETNGGIINKDVYNKVKLIIGTIPPLTKIDGEKISFPEGYLDKYKILPDFINDKFSYVNYDEYINLENNIGCRPYTGIVALNNIIKYKPSELYITGFTCGKDGNNSICRNNNYNGFHNKGNHNGFLIYKFMKKLIFDNLNFIKLDEELLDVLNFNFSIYKINNNLLNYKDEDIYYHYLINSEIKNKEDNENVDKYFLPKNYKHRLNNTHHIDLNETDKYQKEVYIYAKNIMEKYNLNNIIDIGCGSGFKLINYLGIYNTIGYETEPCISFLKKPIL